MTRTIALVIGITAAVFSVGVAPALAGSQDPNAAAPDWFERAAKARQNAAVVVSRPDSHDLATPVGTGYLDAADRAQRIDVIVPTATSDAHERSAPPSGEIASSTDSVSSGRELELPQIGIGFAIGLLVGVGLFLTMRYTRGRQLAH